jgi:predicted  nucleic acid-binding Zn-ribbon protein
MSVQLASLRQSIRTTEARLDRVRQRVDKAKDHNHGDIARIVELESELAKLTGLYNELESIIQETSKAKSKAVKKAKRAKTTTKRKRAKSGA